MEAAHPGQRQTSVRLTDEQFARLFETFREEAFRLETLPRYSVPEELADFEAYLDGAPQPVQVDEEWLSFLRSAAASGRRVVRVRCMGGALTPYLRFEIEWGYQLSEPAGERILLCMSPIVPPAGVGDFWLFDDSTLVLMRYGAAGEFLGAFQEADPRTVAACRATRDEAVAAAIPLREFLRDCRAGGRTG